MKPSPKPRPGPGIEPAPDSGRRHPGRHSDRHARLHQGKRPPQHHHPHRKGQWYHRPGYWYGLWPHYHVCHWHRYGYRPWAWVTWPTVSVWFGYPAQPVYYNYYVLNGYVYNGDARLASVSTYARQAGSLAAAAPAPADEGDWLPLGVFGLAPDGTAEPEVVVQLAAAKSGVVAGTYYHAGKGITLPISGSIDKATQRVAWRVGGERGVLMETGLGDLTKDEASVLIHFPEGVSESWAMTRVNEEAAEQAAGAMKAQTKRLDLAASWDFLQRSLDDDWKKYLDLPADLDAPDAVPEADALKKSLARFERIASNPRYRVVAELPGFHSTRRLLEQYVASLGP